MSVASSSKDSDDSSLLSADDNGTEETPREFRNIDMEKRSRSFFFDVLGVKNLWRAYR